MKTMVTIMFLCIAGMIYLPGCTKDSTVNVPISFTDKEGDIFISIDTISKSFTAYSNARVTKGVLKGIFNDTIKSSFQLAIATPAHWDTIYHPTDTVIFPTHYAGHVLVIQTSVDLTNYTSPYHFILVNFEGSNLKSGPHGNPSILMTVDTNN
jgi:hypothetical protein